MSIIPSLSLWSSIKIPVPLFFTGNKNNGPNSTLCTSSSGSLKQNHFVKDPELAGKLINLNVPGPLKKVKQNPVPNLIYEYSKIYKKKSLNKTPKKGCKKIRFVTVPEIHFFENDDNAIDDLKSNCDKNFEFYSKGVFEEKNAYKWDRQESLTDLLIENYEGNKEDIPSVKPYTTEELEELNKKYNLMEETIALRKNTKLKVLKPLKKVSRLRQKKFKTGNFKQSTNDEFDFSVNDSLLSVEDIAYMKHLKLRSASLSEKLYILKHKPKVPLNRRRLLDSSRSGYKKIVLKFSGKNVNISRVLFTAVLNMNLDNYSKH